MKILSGDLESTKGHVAIQPGVRMSVLKQDQFQYDAYSVWRPSSWATPGLYEVGKEKDALYEKPDFSDEDGLAGLRIGGEFCRIRRLGGRVRSQPDPAGPGRPGALHQDKMAIPTAA